MSPSRDPTVATLRNPIYKGLLAGITTSPHFILRMTDPKKSVLSGTSSDMEKLPIHTNEDLAVPQPRWATAEQRQNRPPKNCLLRRIFIALVCFAGFYLFVTRGSEFRLPAPCHASGFSKQTIADHKEQAHTLNSDNLHAPGSHKIPLEAHIMSKCPDAKSCLKELILPTMEQVSDKVDFQLSFIAK